ncbi:MAG: MFS transporter [Candidatus Poribacteria bacterium]|nr:MFS transporter [Candidatus Poribacteria bacterium]
MHSVTSYLHVLRNSSRSARLYFITASLVGFTLEGIHALLFNLYLLRLGYGPAFIGLINGIGMCAFAICSLPAGRLTQRWGCRRTMLTGLVLVIAGYGLLLLVELEPGLRRNSWLIVTYVVVSVGAAVYFVNTAPFLMNVTSEKERNHVFSVYAAIGSLAGFTGNLVGGILPAFLGTLLGDSLSQPTPYRWALLIATLLLLPALLIVRATTSDSPSQRTFGKRVKGGSSRFSLILLLSLIRMLTITSLAVVHFFFNVYLDAELDVSIAQIGLVIAFGRLLAVPAALVIPLLTSRWGNGGISLWSSLGSAISLIPLALVPHWGAASLGFAAVMALASIRYPTFMIYTMEVVSPEQRGVASGAGEMAAGGSFAFMALSGGYLITVLGYHSLFLTGAILTSIGTFIFWVNFKNRER